MDTCLRYIGTVRSPFTEKAGTPIQAASARDVEGTVEIFPEYTDGLKDLDGFSHIHLLYLFHLCKGWKPMVVPFLDDRPRGVFSTRAPTRPNRIGISQVRLISVEGSILRIQGVDILDGTPLLDIKPFVPEFDLPAEDVRTGWVSDTVIRMGKTRDDGRFG